jgi:4-carboxymuconolactone decarboxylase
VANVPYAGTEQLQAMLSQSPFPADTHPGNVFRMLGQTPPVGAAALGLIYSVLTDAELDPKLREIAILRVAERSEALYALAQHAPIAASVGVSEVQVSALQQGHTPADLFGDQERTTLAFVDEALDTPHVADATFTRLRVHFPPRQVVELLLIIGCFRMMCRLVTTLDLELEPSFGVDALRRAHQTALQC